MMWIALVLFFAIVGGTQGQGCRTMFITECKIQENFPDKLPKVKEEYDQLCGILENAANCGQRVLNSNCEDEEGDKLELHMHLISLQKLLKLTCENNNVYKAISNNIGCITDFLEANRGVCARSSLSEMRRNLIMTYFEMHQQQVQDTDPNHECSRDVFQIACGAVSISEECGKELLEPVMKSLFTVSSAELYCSEEIIDKIPKFTYALAAVEEEVDDTVNEVKKRKK